MGVGGIGVIADGFERDHADEFELCGRLLFVGAFGGKEVGGESVGVGGGADAANFFEVKENKADGAFEVEGFDGAGDVEEGGDAGAVVVSAGRGGDGVKVCAEDEDFAGEERVLAAELDGNVVPDLRRRRAFFGLSGKRPFYFLELWGIADCGKFFDEEGFGREEAFDVVICAAGGALEGEGVEVALEGVGCCWCWGQAENCAEGEDEHG